jgi:hypothetical protein
VAKPANPPAFPRPMGWNGLSNHEEHCSNDDQAGMSLRDWFAAHAPPMPDEWASYRRTETDLEDVADDDELRLMIEWRWEYADMMLAAREGKAAPRG